MSKVKFKCGQCQINVRRKPERIIRHEDKKLCSETCLKKSKSNA